jgi:glucose/arabinose dehydrogenase
MTAPAGPRAGRSLVRVDLRDWSLHPFLSEGLNRPIDVRFGPSGALYVLDFGYFEIHAGRGLIARKQTDKLWRCQMRTKES